MDDLLEAAVDAAVAAGGRTLRYHGKQNVVTAKADRSPVTEADVASHAEISKRLATEQFGYPLLSEEGHQAHYSERRLWSMFWLVDPLDGTKAFLARSGEFTVNIALVRDGRPELGVIYVPVRDTLYAGGHGRPAFVVEEARRRGTDRNRRAALPRVGNRLRPITVAASERHNTPQTDRFIDVIRGIHGAVRITRASSALKICQLADGIADYYPRFGATMEWDTCAGDAILRAVGGRITRARDGMRLVYNKRTLRNPDFVAAAAGRRIPAAARSVAS